MKVHKKCIRVICLCLVCLLLAGCGSGSQWQKQYDLGQECLLEGAYEEAITAFTAAIGIDPEAADAYIGRAEAYLEGNAAQVSTANLQMALADYTAALELDDTLTDVYVSRGDVYCTLGTATGMAEYLSAAIADYESAIALDDSLTELYLDIAAIYVLMEDYQAAIDTYTLAVDSGMESVEAYVGRAEACLAADTEGETEDEDGNVTLSAYQEAAAEDYEAALALGAEDAQVYLAAAELYVLAGDYDSAAELLKSYTGTDESVTDMLESLEEELQEEAARDELMQTIRENWLDDLVELAVEFEEETLAYDIHDTDEIFPDELLALLEDQEDALVFELEDGYYLGIYHYGDGLYYGEMENGVRSGYGVWIILTDPLKGDETMHCLIGYVGEWADDLPNGWGNYQAYSEYYLYGYVYVYGYEISFVDGTMDGEGTYYVRDSLFSSFNQYALEVEDGVVVSGYGLGDEVRSPAFKTYYTSY